MMKIKVPRSFVADGTINLPIDNRVCDFKQEDIRVIQDIGFL